jgi:hypothetical protein
LANIKQILNVFHTPAASTAMTTTVLSYRWSRPQAPTQKTIFLM